MNSAPQPGHPLRATKSAAAIGSTTRIQIGQALASKTAPVRQYASTAHRAAARPAYRRATRNATSRKPI